MWQALIAAGASLLGNAISSGVSARKAQQAKSSALAAEDRKAQRLTSAYNYANGLPRYELTTQLNQMYDQIRDRKAAREGAKNVIGGTQASVQAGNQQDLNAVTQVAQTGISKALDDRKQNLKDYTTGMNQIEDSKAAIESGYQTESAKNTAAVGGEIAKTAANFIGSTAADSATTSSNTTNNAGGAAAGTTGETVTRSSSELPSYVTQPTIGSKVQQATQLQVSAPETGNQMASNADAMGMGKVRAAGASALNSVPKTNMTGNALKDKADQLGWGRVRNNFNAAYDAQRKAGGQYNG